MITWQQDYLNKNKDLSPEEVSVLTDGPKCFGDCFWLANLAQDYEERFEGTE